MTTIDDFVFCGEDCFETAFRRWLEGWGQNEAEFMYQYFRSLVAKRKAKAMMEALRSE